jgi:hypothetical protein
MGMKTPLLNFSYLKFRMKTAGNSCFKILRGVLFDLGVFCLSAMAFCWGSQQE